jgi:hypothetical protein
MTVSPVHFTSKSDRWFTPPDLEREIRTFLGGSYFDPCPARVEGKPIHSGLWLRWEGRVFVNPPYGRVIGRWVVKAMTEPVDELLLLVPARPETKWFTPCFSHTILFFSSRLRFTSPTARTTRREGAPFPSALVYVGPRVAEFTEAFSHRGAIVRAVGRGIA